MKVLLAFLVIVFVLEARTISRGRTSRPLVLLGLCFVVAAAYLTQRAY